MDESQRGLPKGNLSGSLSVEDFRVSTVDLHRRSDAREDEVCASHSFPGQSIHPTLDSLWEFMRDDSPVANRGVFLPGPTDEVNASGECSRVSCPESSPHLSG